MNDWLREGLDAPPDPRPLESVSEVLWHAVEGGTMRILHHVPEVRARRPLVLLPGFGANVSGWTEFYARVIGRVELWVIETLEKSSTPLSGGPLDLGPPRLARDVASAMHALGLDRQDLVMLGSSWGATVLLEGLAQGVLHAPTAIAYDPTPRLMLPRWALRHIVPYAPVSLVEGLREPIAKLLMRKLTQPEQRRRAEIFVHSADVFRWREGAAASGRYALYPRLAQIQQEVLVVNGSHDAVHDRQLYPDIARAIPHGRFFFLEVDEREREHLSAFVARALADRRAEDGVPAELAAFEVPLR